MPDIWEDRNAIPARGSGTGEHFLQVPSIQPIRRNDVIVRELDGEAIIYDQRYGTVHHFSELALLVWKKFDGTKTEEEIAEQAAQAKVVDAAKALTAIRQILRQFTKWHLLQTPAPSSQADYPECRTQTTTEKDVIDTAHPAATQELRASMGMDSDVASDVPNYSRRELLAGGALKLLFVPPLVSSFIPSGAYASGGNGLFSYDCKLNRFSCAVDADCCQDPAVQQCKSSECCIPKDQGPCDTDAECCTEASNGCDAGTCRAA